MSWWSAAALLRRASLSELPARRCRRHRASVGRFLSYSALRRDWRAVPAMSGPPRGCCRNRWRWPTKWVRSGGPFAPPSAWHTCSGTRDENARQPPFLRPPWRESPRAPALRILTTQRNCCCSYGHKSEGCASWVILLLASIDCNCITASGGGHRQYRRQVRSLRQNAPGRSEYPADYRTRAQPDLSSRGSRGSRR